MNIGQHRTPRDSVTGYRDDARTEELHKLRLALATFALQLDAFEMRTRNAALRTGMTPKVPVWPLDIGCRLQGKKRLVDKVTWQQAGRVTEPGRYMFRFGWLTVTAEDLAIWEKLPNAAFSLVRTTAATDAGDEFRLGAFELREDLSLSDWLSEK